MLFGDPITAPMLVPGGAALVALLAFQLLTGLRVIRFKGRRHGRIHRWGGFLMGVVAAGHAVLGLAFAYGWHIL